MRALLQRISADHRARFVAVGVTNTAVGYAVFVASHVLLFASLAAGYMLALVVSYAVGICVAFVLYRRFVFRDDGPWWRSLPRFIGVYVVSIALNAVLLPILVAGAGWNPIVAQAVCIVTTTLLSYAGHRWFSFRGGAHGDDMTRARS